MTRAHSLDIVKFVFVVMAVVAAITAAVAVVAIGDGGVVVKWTAKCASVGAKRIVILRTNARDRPAASEHTRLVWSLDSTICIYA